MILRNVFSISTLLDIQDDQHAKDNQAFKGPMTRRRLKRLQEEVFQKLEMLRSLEDSSSSTCSSLAIYFVLACTFNNRKVLTISLVTPLYSLEWTLQLLQTTLDERRVVKSKVSLPMICQQVDAYMGSHTQGTQDGEKKAATPTLEGPMTRGRLKRIQEEVQHEFSKGGLGGLEGEKSKGEGNLSPKSKFMLSYIRELGEKLDKAGKGLDPIQKDTQSVNAKVEALSREKDERPKVVSLHGSERMKEVGAHDIPWERDVRGLRELKDLGGGKGGKCMVEDEKNQGGKNCT
ncbi:hypothetical protein CR513_05857, partial [Mucuna pruriens]